MKIKTLEKMYLTYKFGFQLSVTYELHFYILRGRNADHSVAHVTPHTTQDFRNVGSSSHLQASVHIVNTDAIP
jgi:hypothetical protein